MEVNFQANVTTAAAVAGSAPGAESLMRPSDGAGSPAASDFHRLLQQTTAHPESQPGDGAAPSAGDNVAERRGNLAGADQALAKRKDDPGLEKAEDASHLGKRRVATDSRAPLQPASPGNAQA